MSYSPLQSTRREDRETALSLLYETDMSGDPVADVLDRNLADPEEYSTAIVDGVFADLDAIDAAIDDVAEEWTVSRMPGIDRSILRMGVFELMHRFDVPQSAVVSEAVALANQYSTEKSAPFINGVLVKLAGVLRADDESE